MKELLRVTLHVKQWENKNGVYCYTIPVNCEPNATIAVNIDNIKHGKGISYLKYQGTPLDQFNEIVTSTELVDGILKFKAWRRPSRNLHIVICEV